VLITGEAPCPAVPCQLTSIEPSTANVGTTITLEGTFAQTMIVNFPGGVSVPATVLGSHRATAIVPASVTAGDLTVSTGDTTIGPLPFWRPSFALGVQAFEQDYDALLAIGRYGHASAVVGSLLYVVGGFGASGELDSVERARINADGSLGRFVTVSGTSLSTARHGHTAVVLGNNFYVLGGTGAGGRLNTVERAIINPDGSIGIFATVPGVTLETTREGHASAVIGNALYILGGIGPLGYLSSIERARIGQDNSLGPFAAVSGLTLVTARSAHATAVTGGFLYVIGGHNVNDDLSTVERAVINADGSLRPFSMVADTVLMTPRHGHTSAVVGSSLYALGGRGPMGPLNSVERANIAPDGTTGSFTTVPGLTFATAGESHTSTIVGSFLYILGGTNTSGVLSRVERASLNADGALGPFVITSNTTLTTPRDGHTSAILGRSLYVLAGDRLNHTSSVERAAINPDGSLGPFAIVPDINLGTLQGAHMSAEAGNFLYVVGGIVTGGLRTNTIQRAAIEADGSIGSFAVFPGVTLVDARAAASMVVVGKALYVIGGNDGQFGAIGTVERATINSDGSLATFGTVSGVTLVTARQAHTSAVLGNFVYVIGGVDSSGVTLSSIERASIAADGSLGQFTLLSDVALASARADHTSMVVGNYLYVIGGGAGTAVTSVERAAIGLDGSLAAFAIVPGVDLVSPRVSATNAMVRNTLYVIGGIGGGSVFDTLEQANLP
jgi:Kelch motif protein